jgi:hypothetical protein
MTWPINIDVAALEFVYSAKLCGALSLFVKFIVTAAPAGTVIVVLSNTKFSVVRLMETLCIDVGGGGGVGADEGVGGVTGIVGGVAVGIGMVAGIVVAAGEAGTIVTGGVAGIGAGDVGVDAGIVVGDVDVQDAVTSKAAISTGATKYLRLSIIWLFIFFPLQSIKTKFRGYFLIAF